MAPDEAARSNGPAGGVELAHTQANPAANGAVPNGAAPAANGGPPASASQKEGGEHKKGADVTKLETLSGKTVEVDFKEIAIPYAYQLLKSSPKGLTSGEHQQRLEKYGPNKLPESHRNPILVYLGYMNNPLSWAMEAAAIIAIALLDFADFALILALLFLNATISYYEESNADKAIKALTAALAPKAKVLRDGELKSIEASDLVPGDVISVRIGDIVPADIKLVGEHDEAPLQVDQAALTGESLPVKRFPGQVCFSGSTIKQGETNALVYATGPNTFFGRAAALISGTNNVANIQKIMTRIGAVCLVTIGIWVIIELAVQFGHYGHSCYAGIDGCPTLVNMLVIIVGGIPIAMPTVLSVTLALGAYKLAKEGAIVARMSAVEEMAGMDILCSDKTGTLTLNHLSINEHDVLPLDGHTIPEVMEYAGLSAQRGSEEAIDVVLIESIKSPDALWQKYDQTKTIPFNPTDKFTVVYILDKTSGRKFRILKGAPQVVMRKAHNSAEIKPIIEEKMKEFALRGFRSLGVSVSEGWEDSPNSRWEMLGLLPLFDPPRHDTKETIERCLEKGVSVKMVTGDQLLIGKEVARQLGMGTNMHTTEVLLKAKEGVIHIEGVKDIDELVETADGFAEVFPEHKFAIVEILQNRHHLVGMTGDGVNDAPALKKADVGIAVAGATEAARGAADIVLTEAGLSTIVTALIGARKIFQRMTTYAKYTIAMTFRICFTFGILTTVYNWYFPTLLIVLLAVFNDGAMIALAKDRVIASNTPNTWHLRNVFITGIVYGIYLSLSSWVLYYLAAKTDFFNKSIHMYELNNKTNHLVPWCQRIFTARGIPASQQGRACDFPPYAGDQELCNVSLLDQCVAEQRWMRESMLRTLIYLQVSVSGQALVFVVRTRNWSFASRAGLLTYIAFFLAQILATIIALFGFNGYETPRSSQEVENCQFCTLSSGSKHPFFASGKAPRAHTESIYTASIMGCIEYVILAWIWAFIWHLPLDLIKWAMAWILNEDGFREQNAWRQYVARARKSKRDEDKAAGMDDVQTGPAGIGRVSWQNPMGRPMHRISATPVQLQRASIVRVDAYD